MSATNSVDQCETPKNFRTALELMIDEISGQVRYAVLEFAEDSAPVFDESYGSRINSYYEQY